MAVKKSSENGHKRRLAGVEIPEPGSKVAKAPDGLKSVTFPPLRVVRLKIPIVGITPLIVCKFDQKIQREMQDKTEGKAKGANAPKDPEREYNAARYIAKPGGWDGLHAGGVRAAIIDAARLVDGLTMTELKQMIFVSPDGYSEEGAPLVRIDGKVERFSNMCRTTTGVAYPRHRPRYPQWRAVLQIQAVGLTAEQVTHLVRLAGFSCGLCEWRPTSPKSKTGDHGRFVIEGDDLDGLGV